MASYCKLALPSGDRPASLATHPVLASTLPQPVVLRTSSFWALTRAIMKDREYLERRPFKETLQTLIGRVVRRRASGHGDKVIPLERRWPCRSCRVAVWYDNAPQILRRRRVRESAVRRFHRNGLLSFIGKQGRHKDLAPCHRQHGQMHFR